MTLAAVGEAKGKMKMQASGQMERATFTCFTQKQVMKASRVAAGRNIEKRQTRGSLRRFRFARVLFILLSWCFYFVLGAHGSAAQSFTLSAGQPISVLSGGPATSMAVTITTSGGFNSPVALTTSNVPSGATVSIPPCWSSAPTSGSTCNLTVSTTSSVSAGSYTITIKGTGGGVTASTTFVLYADSFTVSASPTSLSVAQGSSGASTINVTMPSSPPGMNTINLTASGQPSGTTIGFSPTSLPPTSGSTSTMTMNVGSTTTPGTYTISVTGTMSGSATTAGTGSITRTTTVTLTVTSGGSFTVAWNVTQGEQSFYAGTCETVGYTVTPSGGFNSPVTVTASTSQSGLTATVNSTNQTVSVCATTSVPAGNYPIILTGTGGSLAETATWSPFVYNFTISASPTSVSVSPGSNGTSTITVADPPNQASPTVSLAATGQPSGVTVSFSPSALSANPNPVNSTMTITVASGTAPGSYPITVTGAMNGGGPSYTKVVTLNVAGFTLPVQRGPYDVMAGSNIAINLNNTLIGGFSAAINMSASTSQSGFTASISPSTVATPGSGTYTLTVSATSTVPGGEYPVTLTGTSGGVTQTVTWNIFVTNFTVSASPTSVTVMTGNSGTSAITVNNSYGTPSASTISLSATGQPSGVTVSFSPSTAIPNTTTTSTMTIAVPSGTAPGTYPITVKGIMSGGPTQTTVVTLTVPGFTLPVQMGPYDVMAGSNIALNLNNTLIGGFNAAINMSASTSQSGLTATVNPTTVIAPGSGTYTLTFSAASSVPGGQYPVTITGTGGGVTQTVTWNIYVTNFTVSASPTSVTVTAGNSGTSAITVNNSYGTPAASTIGLSATGQPSGVTVSFSPAGANPNTTTTSTMTIVVASGTAPGTYPITVKGIMSGGVPTQSTTVSLTVPSPGSFTIPLWPWQGPFDVMAGTSYGPVTISNTLTGGFNEAITMSASSPQPGLTATFSPNPIAAPGSGSYTVNVSAASTVPNGQYALTLTGTAVGITETTIWNVYVTNFSIAATPTSVSVPPGSSGTSTIAVNNPGGTPDGAPVGLSATGQPSGVTVNFSPSGANPTGVTNSTMTINVASNVAPGTYPITVTGTMTGGGPTQTATVNLIVTSGKVYDSGSVVLTVTEGSTAYSDTVLYNANSNPETIAANLAAGSIPNITLSAAGGSVYMVTTTTGSTSDYTYSLAGTSSYPTDFPSASFGYPAITGSFDGGSNTTTGTGNLYSYSINYDAAGDVTSYSDSSVATTRGNIMGAWSFTYDSLHRVEGAKQTNWIQATTNLQYFCWNYDPFGNRLQQLGSSLATSGGGSTACQAPNGATTSIATATMSTGNNNQIYSASVSNVHGTYTYDANGNVTYDGKNTYLYDAEGNICASASTPVAGMTVMTGYLYDADGTRVAKGTITSMSCDPTANGFQTTADYIIGPAGEQLTEMDANGTGGSSGMVWDHTNVWAAGQLIATFDKDSVTGPHYMLNDWLGSRRVQTNALGVYEQSCQSLPYGDGLNCSGSVTTPTEHHFTGKERDAETGNDYFGARYYASSVGRWLSPDWSAKEDPVPYAKLDDPQTLDLYTYLQNNPLDGVDADGHACGHLLLNYSSGFCTRAREYEKWDKDSRVNSQTRFFAAASDVSDALGSVAVPWFGLHRLAVSGDTEAFLESVGEDLYKLNASTVTSIRNGSLRGPGLDSRLVHIEQTEVQHMLDKLQKDHPELYKKITTEINASINPHGAEAAVEVIDYGYNKIMKGARDDKARGNNQGKDFDFTNQSDREFLGNTLVDSKHASK